MSSELEKLLESTYKLRGILSQVLNQEAVDYLITLVVKDNAHRKFLKLTDEVDISVK